MNNLDSVRMSPHHEAGRYQIKCHVTPLLGVNALACYTNKSCTVTNMDVRRKPSSPEAGNLLI